MHVALDVWYGPASARGAAIGFASATDEMPAFAVVEPFAGAPSDYEPGDFKKRELPYLVKLVELSRAHAWPTTILVDGYVFLDGGRLGLGGHLYEALDRTVPVIGVAKTRYRDAVAIELLRGTSKSPLLISAAGMEPAAAAAFVASLHGEHRIPTMLRLVDRASRDAT
jgi:deoxyribonuclease V